ncbi:hypothetical protein DH2020_004490 [Rehmannia glutinosa]|uniref:SET domain-containing protein n=1 Tax=Rehmannia glutinosa TaxID=99300 RepID=A0ABR0XPS3_REHGL
MEGGGKAHRRSENEASSEALLICLLHTRDAAKVKNHEGLQGNEEFGLSRKTVRPVVKELLKLYEDNWMLIEEDNYRVLVEAILDSEEQKARNVVLGQLDAWSEDEAEENEPFLKRPRLSSQKNQSSPLFHASMPNCSNEVEDQPHGKQKLAEFTSDKYQDKDIKLKAPHVATYCRGKWKTNSSPLHLIVADQAEEYNLISDNESDETKSPVPFVQMENCGDESDLHHDFSGTANLYDDHLALEENVSGKHLHEVAHECEPLSYELPGFEVSLPVVPPDPPRLLLQGSSYENCSNAKESCSIYPEVIDLDAEDICTDRGLIPKDTYSVGKSCDLEGNHSESMDYKNSEAEKIEYDAQDTLKLDIASSLEAVLKQVEEQCLKSYRIPQAGFSLLGLMKEVCECFLAAGTTSTYTEDVKPENEMSSLGNSIDPDSEICPAEGTDDQLNLFSKSTISNDPVIIRNLFQISPQFPRFVGSVHLDLSRCRIYLNMDVSGSVKMDRHIKELNSRAPSSSEIVIVQKQRCYHYVKDITKGQEACEISLINEINEDQGPTFNYIPKNVTYKNACVRFPLARISEQNCCSNCSGDCLSLEIPCTCGGKLECEFAYTLGGLVKETFMNNFISKSYSVQQNDLFYCEDCPLERSNGGILVGKCKGHVFMTPDRKGWGLRTLEDIPKGAFICEYVGEVVTSRELFERNIQNSGDKHTYPVLLDADWNSEGVVKDEEALCLDASVYGNIARFINHRCFDANLVGIPVEVETPDHHYYHLAFFTTREVSALEEITWDYGIDFNDCHPVKAFQCHCGSKFCRDRKSVKS